MPVSAYRECPARLSDAAFHEGDVVMKSRILLPMLLIFVACLAVVAVPLSSGIQF